MMSRLWYFLKVKSIVILFCICTMILLIVYEKLFKIVREGFRRRPYTEILYGARIEYFQKKINEIKEDIERRNIEIREKEDETDNLGENERLQREVKQFQNDITILKKAIADWKSKDTPENKQIRERVAATSMRALNPLKSVMDVVSRINGKV